MVLVVMYGVRCHREPQRKNAENHSEKHSAALRLLRGSLRSNFLFEEFNPANYLFFVFSVHFVLRNIWNTFAQPNFLKQ